MSAEVRAKPIQIPHQASSLAAAVRNFFIISGAGARCNCIPELRFGLQQLSQHDKMQMLGLVELVFRCAGAIAAFTIVSQKAHPLPIWTTSAISCI